MKTPPAFRLVAARPGLWALATLVALGQPLDAQEIPKDEYLRFVPLEVPRIVGQTDASARFRLYGDPNSPDFVDVAPLDGVDDRRMAVLEALGLRFAPFLVQSSEMVPLDFRAFARVDGLPLHVDRWETAMQERLISEETIDWMGDAGPCPAGSDGSADCRVHELLADYHPATPASAVERARSVTPRSAPFELLWLDFPGGGPAEWKAYFAKDDRSLRDDLRDDVKTYLHPFLEEVEGPGDEPLYQLVLQYWFFYPYNDGGNNHEGDWEHIHVIPAPRDRVTEPGLTAAEVREILDGSALAVSGDRGLVMKRVEYYFHSKVAFLDFSSPNVYADRGAWDLERRTMANRVAGGDAWERYLRFMAYRDAAETEINTHPIGYIGADNKGLDQILSAPGPKNRDSHGTYPAPGLFKDIGPAGATEDVHPSFDHQKFFASSAAEQEERLTRFARGGVVFMGDPGKVEIVPDWEPVIDVVMSEYDARRRWSWFLLPIRWGYPAHESPLAGIVAHAETGNISIVGPAFNSGWNRSGVNQQYVAYDPHVLPRPFPTALQDAFSNEWGFMNATLPTLSFLPPFDALWRIVAAPIRLATSPMDRVFYPAETVPFRFVGLRAGVTKHWITDEYADLLFNATQGPAFIAGLIDYIGQSAGPETEFVDLKARVEDQVAPVYLVDLYVGHHIVTTNGLRHARSDVGATFSFSDIDPFVVNSELNMWEYTGSLRYSVFTDGVQPFVRAGYGLSWYRLEEYSLNGQPIDPPESRWVRKPGFFHNLLPNTWHYGVGIEVIPVRKFAALPAGIDVGLTIEWQQFHNKLGLDQVGVDIADLIAIGVPADQLPRERWVSRHAISASLAISF
jgi:hypothetical protein